MRVVSGLARGVNLESLEGLETRPTIDRVKEAMFSMIQSHIYDGIGLDLFAGSGALGIEFISRGGQCVTFVEQSSKAVDVIKRNLAKTKLEEDATVWMMSVDAALQKIDKESIDVIMMDPPYQKGFVKSAIEQIVQYELLRINGIILLEHHRDDHEAMIDFDGLEKIKHKQYGIVGVSVFRRIK